MTQGKSRLSSALENPLVLTGIIIAIVLLVVVGGGLWLLSHALPVGRELAVENDTPAALIVGTNDRGYGSTQVGFRAVKPGTTTPVYEGGLEGNEMPASITLYDANCVQIKTLQALPADEGGLLIVHADGSITANWTQRLSGDDGNWVPNSTCAYAAATLQ